MTEIITVASYKGGNGKTNLIIETIKELIKNGKKILAIDTDVQNGLFQWAEKEYQLETENVVVEVNENLTMVSWSLLELDRLNQFNTQVYDYILRFITKSCTCTCHESMLAVSSRTRNAKRWIFLYPYPRRFISLILLFVPSIFPFE